jgi:collagenase-like PrtC family protease
MKADYRIHGNIIKQEILQSELIDIISIGSEGCVHKIQSDEVLLACKRRAKEYGKAFKLVLPKIPQKDMSRMLKLIHQLSNSGLDYSIVFNDFGLLYACKREALLPKQAMIGRGISRSFEDCLWYEHILRGEAEKNWEILIQNNMYDSYKHEELKEYNIKGIECNMLKHQLTSYENLQNMGYEVNVHYGYVSVAYSRACQTAKYYKETIPNCRERCDKAIDIEMHQIWTRNKKLDASEEKMDEALKAVNPKFLLLGNTLLREMDTNLEKEKFRQADSWIFDSYFWGMKDLEEVL